MKKKILKRTVLRPPLFIYEKFIKRQKEGIPFIIFSFFLATFIDSRIYVYLAIKGLVPESFSKNVRGVHVHHFAYGIFLNTIVGFLALTLPNHHLERWKICLAVLFGIGLGWTFDEFGMWLRLQDEYWIRLSYDAVIIIVLIFINIIYLGSFWKRLAGKAARSLKKNL
jgi:hypothetical protein